MNWKTIVIIAPSMLLIVVACSSDDDNGDEIAIVEEPTPTDVPPSPTSEPEPTPTSESEPTPTAEAEPEAPVDEATNHEEQQGPDDNGPSHDGETGLDDDGFTETDDPFGTVPSVHLEEFHNVDLGGLLLQQDHLPAGWELMAEGSLPDDAEATHSLGDMMSGPCDTDLLSPERMGHPVHVGRYFIGPDFGPFFSQDLFQFHDEAAAIEAMELAQEQLNCDGWVAQDPDTGMDVEYTVEALDFPELGDETRAISVNIGFAPQSQAGVQPVQQEIQFEGFFDDITFDTVLIRQGTLMTSINYMSWFGDAEFDLRGVSILAAERTGAQ
jgi:hypothetical protein